MTDLLEDLGNVKLCVRVQKLGEDEFLIKNVYIEFGHKQFLEIPKDIIPEQIWKEIWRRLGVLG